MVIVLPGTMYNIIHGINRYALFLLGMLGLPRDSVGRFRDCFLQRTQDGALEICIYTRNGGPARTACALATETLRTHPLYVRDHDDEHDPTYAAYIFRPSDLMCPTLEYMAARDPALLPGSHHERAEAFVRKMTREPNNPEVQRVRNIMGSVISKGRRSQERRTS